MPNTQIVAMRILDDEISSFDYNPKDYIRSLGWDLKKYPKINECSGKLPIATQEEINELAKQLDEILFKSKYSEEIDQVTELYESNPASDYPGNFIAIRINKFYKKLSKSKN